MAQADWHYLEWTPDRARRFWDFAAGWTGRQEEYFSRQVGAGVVNFLRHIVPLHGRILDYGCGPGYLVEHLLAARTSCEGADFSPHSVQAANERFATNPLWKGARLCTDGPLPFPTDTFDLIISAETIEHVLPAQLPVFVAELRRILKTGSGHLFITTPNSEVLATNQVFCAECGSVFHRSQHVSSFTPEGLTTLLGRQGFRTDLCGVTDFGRFQQPWLISPFNWSPRYFARLLVRFCTFILDAIHFPGKPLGGWQIHQFVGHGPHLFWLGTKEEAVSTG